jgi:hypothetical protein
VLDVFDSSVYRGGLGNPAYKFHVGYGYDPEIYIATAQLAPSPYLTQELCAAKVGGLNRLIAALDDSKPPIGTLAPIIGGRPNPACVTFNDLVQIVTTEINGYLSTIYPIPLAQTGTVAVFEVIELTTDGSGGINTIQTVEAGNYATAPAVNQNPVYLRQIDPISKLRLWQNISNQGGVTPFLCESGTGAQFTVAYQALNYSDESGQVLQAQSVNGTPAIAAAGNNYQLGDLLVITGGSSFVPAKLRQAALEIFFYECYKRRLAPDEQNPGFIQSKHWRNLLVEIQEGEKQLDGTYKRFFAPVSSWNVKSVLNGANSL